MKKARGKTLTPEVISGVIEKYAKLKLWKNLKTSCRISRRHYSSPWMFIRKKTLFVIFIVNVFYIMLRSSSCWCLLRNVLAVVGLVLLDTSKSNGQQLQSTCSGQGVHRPASQTPEKKCNIFSIKRLSKEVPGKRMHSTLHWEKHFWCHNRTLPKSRRTESGCTERRQLLFHLLPQTTKPWLRKRDFTK